MTQSFDYIVVGAGSAGCALANRLSSGPKNSVLLVEAGGKDTNPWIHVPVGYFKTMGNPKTDWCFTTQPDPGLNGRAIPWPRGKVLGGCSSINGLLYVRGQAEDYDHWRDLGNEGWGWSDIEPIFKRMENWQGLRSSYRGDYGPITVSPTQVSRPVVDCWIRAAENAGYPSNSDYNGPQQEGVSLFQLTLANGRRCSSAVAYLNPAKHRSNLTIMTKTQVQRIIFAGKRAVGLITDKGEIKAKREVILSAGSLASPQLLMVSGIGNPDQLLPHKINLVHELNGVGQNLQDHLQARPIFKVKARTINTEINSWFKQGLIGIEYMIKRTGPMTMAASLGTGFLKTKLSPGRPDIQFHIQPFSADRPADGPHKFDAFTASVLQMRPESTGHLDIISGSMIDPPLIYPNYLATEKDQKTLIEGIKIARKISQLEPLKSLIIDEYAPGKEVSLDDDMAILQWARNNAVTIYHPTGTCKMGLDDMAVVNCELKVHGIEGLRVADASIMPAIVSGNTNAAAIMIGEKAADLIMK